MRKIILNCLMFVLSLYFISSAIAQEDPSAEINKLADQFFSQMQESKFEEAAKLFHFPPSYSHEERNHDIAAVARMLEFFSAEFGKSNSPHIDHSEALFWNLLAMGGDIPYWQANPTYLQIRFSVKFSKEGDGYVILQFCRIIDKWEIRAAAYGLPADRPDSKARITQLSQKMMEVMKSFMEPLLESHEPSKI